MKPAQEWSEAERFVWEKTRAGEEANFNIRENKRLDPKSSTGWDGRRISSEFLETILFEKQFREKVARKGVRIVGACFSDEIDLEDGHLPWSLGLRHSRFENGLINMGGLQAERQVSLEGSFAKRQLNLASALIGEALFVRAATFEEVILRGTQIKGQLSMIGARVRGKLDMASVLIGKDLLMGDAAFEEVMLRGMRVGGQLSMNSVTVTGTLDLSSVSIGGALLMAEGATFGRVMLRGAQIGDQLSMIGATVKGELDSASVSIGGALLMAEGATFGRVMLRGAQIGDQLSMNNASVTGTLDMDSVSIGDSLLMRDAVLGKVILRGAQIKGQLAMRRATVTGELDMTSVSIGNSLLMDSSTFTDVNLDFATIGSILNLTDGTFETLDLTGVTVEGELRLITGKKSVEWLPDSKTRPDQIQLNLHNAQAGALVDSPKSWPDKIELRGFTYRQLGGPMQEDDPSERPVDDFIKWLSCSKTFSFQPYQQLATVLRDAGKSGTANAVLFAAKKRERQNATGWWRRVGLRFLECGIGYGIGIYTWMVLYWAMFFVLFGWGVLCIWEEPQNHWEPIGFWFSLDYLLPIIRLRDTHYETVNLSSGVRLYFYIHQIIGYVLASLLIAALSGIIRSEK